MLNKKKYVKDGYIDCTDIEVPTKQEDKELAETIKRIHRTVCEHLHPYIKIRKINLTNKKGSEI